MTTDKSETPTELRRRAARFREMARNFSNDDVGQKIIDVADELDARASALEADKPM